MIIKGKSRGNGAQLGVYLITPGDNERIEVLEIRGVAATDVPGAVLEMEAHAAGTQCVKPLYHASINPRVTEAFTEEQWVIAVDRLEAKLGLTGQPRVVVLHQKEGRQQIHIAWGRIDLEHMRAISALSVLKIFRSVVDDPVPCAGASRHHRPPRSPELHRRPRTRICEQQTLKRNGDVDQQPQRRLEPVGLLGAARSHSSLESAAPRARA